MEQCCYGELRHPIHTIAAELVDPSPCTRRSALGKLQCALTSEILATCDPEKDAKALFRSLLEWFNLPSPSHEILILNILSRLAQDDGHRQLLVDLGAVEFMQQFQADCCQTISPYVSTLLQHLLRPTAGEAVKSIYLHDTGRGYVVPARCLEEEPVCEVATERLQCRQQEFNKASRDCQVKGSLCPLTVDIPERNERLKEETDCALYKDGRCESQPRGEMARCAHILGSRAESPASAKCIDRVASPSFQSKPLSQQDQEKVLVPTQLNSPVKKSPESQPCSNGPHTDSLDPILPCIDLEEGDDKYLFNLNGTLQNLDRRPALYSALKELREAVVFDFHPEALFQKYSIVQNAFVLLQKVADRKLEQIVFDFLVELIRKIKASLKLSREAGFQVHPDNESPLHGVQDSGSASLVKCGLDLKCSYPVYLKQSAHDALDDEDGFHLLDKRKLDNKGSIQPVISLGRTLHIVALQLMSLLANERHRDMTFAILYDLLPLLKPPATNFLDKKVQAPFTQYFHALCEVLQTLNGNSLDLETLCMDVATKQDFYERAHGCLPILRVLSFSAELLCLLQPSHVAGLVPSALVKAFITLSGDLILGECTFGIHKMISPYLKYLNPDFFRSYTRATEASFTLHVLVKELASSEEVVAQWKVKRPNPSLKINTELLLKCMIQAVPNYSYFNHRYLVPRIVHIVPDVLRMELVKACRESVSHETGKEVHDGKSRPTRIVSLERLIGLARSLIWLLISHPSAPVRQVVYDSLLEVSSRERWQAQHSNSKPQLESGLEEACVVGGFKICIGSDEPDYIFHCRDGALRPMSVLHRLLIFGTSIMGEIIATGLHDTATCKQSGVLLQHLIGELSEIEHEYIIPGYPWIACSAYLSPDVLQIVEQLNSNLFAAKALSQKGRNSHNGNSLKLEWAQFSCTLRSLFSSCIPERYRASTELLMILRQFCTLEEYCWWLRNSKNSEIHSVGFSRRAVDIPPDDPVQFLKDPFQKCLKFKEATLFSLAFGISEKEDGKSEKSRAPADGQKKVEDLLGVFKANSVGESIRKTAVENLTWLIQDQCLRALLDRDEELFKALIVEIFDWMRKSDRSSDGSIPESSNRSSHRSHFDRTNSPSTSPTDLGIACLSLLARLAPAPALDGSPNLRDLLIGDSCKVLWLLIPLVFHPFDGVRKDMALLLAFTLFSSDLLLRGLKEIVFDRDPSEYPFSTKEILGANIHSVENDICIAVPLPFIGGHLFPCRVVSVAVRPPAQSLAESNLDEQLIHRFIAQSVLLKGGYENLLTSLERRVASAEDPLRTVELQAMACLSVLHADISVKKILKLLTDPQLSWGSETQFLEELEAQCFRHPQAAKMLGRSSWVVTFQRFLTKIPSTPEESAQLLKVLRLVQKIISSKSSGYSGLLFMAMVSKQILLPILAKSPSTRLGANLHHAIVLIDGYPASDMDFTILRLFVDILLCSKEHGDASLFGQIAVALAKGTSLLPVLLSKFLKGPSAPYVCCVLAVQCVSLIAKGVAAAVNREGYLPGYSQQKDKESSSEASSEQQGDVGLRNSHGEGDILQQESGASFDEHGNGMWATVGIELVDVVLPLIKHMAHLHSHHYLSLRHKQLVREIVSCLWSVTSSVPPHLWEDLWSSTGITYWLARLLDDQEAIIRGMGFGILAVLASPVTIKTRALLEQHWPELGDVAVHTILNTQECYAVREEALRFLISTTIWSSGRRRSSPAERHSIPAGFERIDSLGVNAALQRYKFWILFTRMLEESDGTAGFHRVLLELILKLTISDLGFIKNKLSVNPCVFDLMIEYLEFGTAKGRELCLHSPDIYSTKAHIGEIICVLSQQEDAQIQSLIQNEYVIAKLLCALTHCLAFDATIGQNTNQCEGNEGQKKEFSCSADNKYSVVKEYERLEAIYHVSEALNLVASQLLQDAAPAHRMVNHVRVNDIMSFNDNLREGKSQARQGRIGVSFQSGLQIYLGEIVGKSGVCRSIAHILSKVPLVKDVRSAGYNETGITLRVSLQRMQLAVCALLATFLSEESLAKAVLENDGALDARETISHVGHQKPHHLAPILYNSFLLVIKEIHELGRKPKVSHNGDILVYLYTMLFTVGVALQNLISFSAQAREFAVDSDLPPKLVGHAYEAYALLGSCGLAPMKNVCATSLVGLNNQRSKPCNKVPKLVLKPIRPSIWSRTAKQGKISEHHRSLLLGELIIYFRLLKNLVFENPRAADACGGEGLFDFIRMIWGFALSEEDLLNEILGLLCNLAAQSDTAKEVMACQTQICQGGKGGSLMDYATVIVLRRPSEQMTYTLAIGLLQILVTMAKARAVFLRKQYLTEFLQQYSQSVHNNDVLRQHLLLQLFINVSVYPNGQKMLSKGLSDGSMLDLVLDTVEQTHYVPASSSALFLLRNLAFCRETRFFFLCNDRTLPLLVKSLASSSLEARANAASALWILISTERRISSVLKKIDAYPSIATAHEAAKLHLKIFQTHVQNSANEQDGTRTSAALISKMGKLVKHIEQSLFAVTQLIGGTQEYE